MATTPSMKRRTVRLQRAFPAGQIRRMRPPRAALSCKLRRAHCPGDCFSCFPSPGRFINSMKNCRQKSLAVPPTYLPSGDRPSKNYIAAHNLSAKYGIARACLQQHHCRADNGGRQPNRAEHTGRLRVRALQLSRARNSLFIMVLSTLMIPFQSILIPLFVMIVQASICTTRLFGLALVYITFQLPFGIFLMRNSFLAVPQRDRRIGAAGWLQLAESFFIE